MTVYLEIKTEMWTKTRKIISFETSGSITIN
jgi:hypothetical protein